MLLPQHPSDFHEGFSENILKHNKRGIDDLKAAIEGKKEPLTEQLKNEIMVNLNSATAFYIADNGWEINDLKPQEQQEVASFDPTTDMEIRGHEIIDLRQPMTNAA